MNYRNLRVANVIRDELAKIILKEFEFDEALVTITEVEVNGKMDRATVLVSVLPSTKAAAVLEELAKAHGRLQHMLLKKINIWPMPIIHFEIDRGMENAATVEKALLNE